MRKDMGQRILKDNSIININTGVFETKTGQKKNWDEVKASPKLIRNFLADKFSKNYLLAAQSDEVLLKLLPFLERVSFSSRENIYQPDDNVDYVYFPETAVISEFQILKDGRTVEIAMTGREGGIGLLSLYGSHPASNWTQVSVAGSAFKLKSKFLKNEILQDQSFQKPLLKFINNYVIQISQRAVCNSYHTLEERFCSWLLMIHDRRGNNKLSLTQEQIARFLGSHRPSITHIAQSLRTKKIIEYVRGQLLILNRQELENIACDCHLDIDVNFSKHQL